MSRYFTPVNTNGIKRFTEAGQPVGWYQLAQPAPEVNVLPGITVPDGLTGMIVQANVAIEYCLSPADALAGPAQALTLQAGGTLTISGRTAALAFCMRLSGAGANVVFMFLTGDIGPAFSTN